MDHSWRILALVGVSTKAGEDQLVLALATMFSVLVGAAGEKLGLDRTLRANTETRKRTHSLLRQGHEYMAGVAPARPGFRRHSAIDYWSSGTMQPSRESSWSEFCCVSRSCIGKPRAQVHL
jgi:hypothetical protein